MKAKKNKIVLITIPGMRYELNTGYNIGVIGNSLQVSTCNAVEVADAIDDGFKNDEFSYFIATYIPELDEELKKRNITFCTVLPSIDNTEVITQCLLNIGVPETGSYNLRCVASEGIISMYYKVDNIDCLSFKLQDTVISKDIFDLLDHGTLDDIVKRIINGSMKFSINGVQYGNSLNAKTINEG